MHRETKSLPFEDYYRFIDVGVRILSDSHQVVSLLRSLYSRFLSNDTAADYEIRIKVNKKLHPFKACIQAPGYRYLVFKSTRGFVLSCENLISGDVERVMFKNGLVHYLSPDEIPLAIDDERSGDDQRHIFPFIQILLLRTVATLMPHRHLLHAAAAAWNDSGIILPAASGRGKTMLSLALVKQGFKFLSDDVACLDLASNHVEPFTRSLNLRHNGRGILSGLFTPGRIEDSQIHGPMDIDELFPASLGQACPLRFVFLLKGEFRSEPELRPISKRQALWRALKLSHTPITKPAEALWRLSPIFEQARCYELTVGELSATAELIRREVELPRGAGLPEPLLEAAWSMWSQVERKPRMRMMGDSMSPIINRNDMLLIDPRPGKIRFGNIVVYRHKGKCIAHRVVGNLKSGTETRLLLKGDNVFVLDPPISREMIMGKVSGKENASSIVDYTSGWWLILNTIIAVFSRLSGRSRILFRILRRLRRLLLWGFRNYE